MWPSWRGLPVTMEHPVPDFHPKQAESPVSARRLSFDLRRKSLDFCAADQPRARVELLKDIFPKLRTLAILANTDHPGEQSEWQTTQRATQALGADPAYVPFFGARELDKALERASKVRADAILVFPDAVTMVHRAKLAEFAISQRLPSMFGWSEYCDAGGLLSYGANQRATYVWLATYADRILVSLRGWLRRGVGAAREVWRSFLKNRVLFVGLPLPCSSNHLRFAARADKQMALEALDRRVQELAREQNADYVVYKEFESTDAGNMGLLEERGYLRGTLPVLHKLTGRFRNFGEYLGAIKARYRNQITRSQKKFAAAGLRAVHVTDGQEIRRRFTPEVHELYAAVHARSTTKLEFLPLEFFREVSDALPEHVAVMFVEDMTAGGRVVGFTLAMRANGTHYNVYSARQWSWSICAHSACLQTEII